MNFNIISLIALSLSMDTFSLSLAYGSNNPTKKESLIISVIVGLFHIIMPLIGLLFGLVIMEIITVKISLIISIIFFYLSLEMIFGVFSKKEQKKMNRKIDIILFAFGVSLDSFSVGIGLNHITNNIILSTITFGIFSFSLTYVGLILGKFAYNKLGTLASVIGSLILLSLALFYLLKCV